MILVLLGTIKIPFVRPLIEIEKCIKNGIISEEVIVQNGFTEFESDNMILEGFLSPDKLSELYNKSSYIITHAGTGSVVNGLKKNKKVIAVPRLKKYNEHVDDHQLDLLKEFENQHHIIAWNENDQLEDIIRRIDDFEPEPFISKKEIIINHLLNFFEEN